MLLLRNFRRTPKATLGTILLALMLTACGGSGRSTVPVVGYVSADEKGVASPTDLTLFVGTCNGQPTVRALVEESEQVTVTVEARDPEDGPSDACRDGVTAQLSRSLGDRAVVDGSTGRVVDPG